LRSLINTDAVRALPDANDADVAAECVTGEIPEHTPFTTR
jgi:hypothetical protein